MTRTVTKTEITKAIKVTETKTENKFNESLKNLNTAIDKKESNAKIEELKVKLGKALETLNAEVKANEFSKILNCKQSALEACKKGAITLTSIKTDKDTQKVTAGTKDEIIDLVELQLFKPEIQICNDPLWAVYIEALNHAILNYNLEIQGIKAKSSKLTKFKISGSASLLNITKDDMATPDGIKKAIQKIVDTIIVGYTVTDTNAMQFLLNYTKWGKAINVVSMPTESNFRRQVMRIMHQIVNNSSLNAE